MLLERDDFLKVAECLLLDALKIFEPDLKYCNDTVASLSFSGLELLEEETEPTSETLYLASCDMLVHSKAISMEDCYIVCCGNEVDLPLGQIHAHVLFLHSNAHINTVFNALNRLFQRLWNWDAKLNEALLSGADAQTFIDLSEHLFANPIVLITDTLHIAAISQKIEMSNSDIQFMREKKYIPENMVQKLTSKPYLEKAESFHTIGFYYPPNYINCTIVIRKFYPNPWRLNILCIYGVNQEPTESDLVLLSHLSEYILAAAKRQQELNSQFSSRSCSFLYSLLSGPIASQAELKATAAFLKLPLCGKYQLYVVSSRIPLESHSQYVLLNLEQMLPSFLKLIYHESILILDQLDDDGTTHEGVIMDALRILLPINNAFCGISQSFSDLRLLKDVYTLSLRTARIGSQLKPKLIYYHLRDYYAYTLVSTAAENFNSSLLYIQQLDRLQEYDKQHKSNNVELLRELLEHERNVTNVSKKMHLHRNSVLYRIEKIQQILDISLDDPDVRLNLMLSFKAMDLAAAKNPALSEEDSQNRNKDISQANKY